jgi:hypothetical protein
MSQTHAPITSQAELAAKLAQDTRRLRQLESLKAGKEAELTVIQAELTRISDAARAEFGTDDADELEEKAAELGTKAAEQVAEFGNKLDGIYADLAEIGFVP